MSGTGDNLVTMTASKGIIQREHQRHAVGFKKFEAPNPFNRMSEEEIEIYKQEVEKRAMTSSGKGCLSGRVSLSVYLFMFVLLCLSLFGSVPLILVCVFHVELSLYVALY